MCVYGTLIVIPYFFCRIFRIKPYKQTKPNPKQHRIVLSPTLTVSIRSPFTQFLPPGYSLPRYPFLKRSPTFLCITTVNVVITLKFGVGLHHGESVTTDLHLVYNLRYLIFETYFWYLYHTFLTSFPKTYLVEQHGFPIILYSPPFLLLLI